MTGQMKKAVYEVPITECFHIELEGVFCGSVELENPEKASFDIQEHSKGEELYFNSSWDAPSN